MHSGRTEKFWNCITHEYIAATGLENCDIEFRRAEESEVEKKEKEEKRCFRESIVEKTEDSAGNTIR